MKIISDSLTLSLLLASSAVATTCNKSNAKAWPTSGVAACMGNAECIAIVLGGQCNAQVLADSGDSKCVRTRKRATLQCTSAEVCYLYTDGELLCHDRATGNYHDENGGTGNTNSGVYTYPNGQVVTNPGTGTFTRPATSTKKTTGSQTSTNTRATTTTGNGTGSTTATSAAVVGNNVAGQTTTSTATASRSSGAAASMVLDEVLVHVGGLVVAVAAMV